jgi:hypothetical protein
MTRELRLSVKRLRDAIAIQNERSHVDAATRRRIEGIVLERGEMESLDETADRVVRGLSDRELVMLVADWLDIQLAI